MMTDWEHIKREFITGEYSYRKLAAMQGVSRTTLARRAAKEDWQKQKFYYRMNLEAAAPQEVSCLEADRQTRILHVADLLLDRIEEILCGTGAVDVRDIRGLTSAVKELKAIQDIQSDLDRQEQQAKISSLTKRAEADFPAEGVQLVIEGLPEGFAI